MKLKKGSLEAKKFMAKIRAKKSKPKKVSGIKKTLRKKTPTKKHTDIFSHNYNITISGINKDNFESLKERLQFNNVLSKFLFDLKLQLKNKSLTNEQKNKIRQHINTARNQIKNNKKMITLLKKLI